MNERPILLHTASGAHPLRVALADGFLTRLRGLMLAPPLAPDAGLLLTRCASVHCAFMRQAIDVVYLDTAGAVVKCVPRVKPWRASAADPRTGARHTLELAAGAIGRLGIRPGDRLEHPGLAQAVRPRVRAHAQGGLAMVEFVVVGPIIAVIGLGIIQYAQLFFAKSQINHASFMAARAGSVGHANLGTIKAEYTKALIPLYGGGTNPAELAESEGKARNAVANSDVVILNPTEESFAAYNEPKLQARYNTNSLRVIPNARLAFKPPSVDNASGQTIQDANLLKLRIIHSYKPTIPLARTIFSAYLKAADPRNDAAYTRIVQDNGIPVVTHVTLHMQSDAIEGSPISAPGPGNGGNPTNPGDPPVSDTPSPPCTGIACNEEVPPDPVDPNAPCTGPDCPVCPVV